MQSHHIAELSISVGSEAETKNIVLIASICYRTTSAPSIDRLGHWFVLVLLRVLENWGGFGSVRVPETRPKNFSTHGYPVKYYMLETGNKSKIFECFDLIFTTGFQTFIGTRKLGQFGYSHSLSHDMYSTISIYLS
jgi:hypothetical protein